MGVYSGLQEAVNTANHDILLHKLYNYGIRGIAHNWFSNYLCNRKQYTVVGGSNSNLLIVV